MLEDCYRLSSHIDPFMKTQRKKNGYATSYAQIRVHHGTHIDFPDHVVGVENGPEWPQWNLSGRCLISTVDVTESPGDHFLADSPEIVLFDTGGKELTSAHIDAILDSNVRIVGTDNELIGDLEAHQRLLSNDVLIIERIINLDEPPVRHGDLYCFCSLIQDCPDGAPIHLAFDPD